MQHFESGDRYGLFTNVDALPKFAWLTFLNGDAARAVELLVAAADRQDGAARALSLYYRGAILNRLARYDEACQSLDESLAASPGLVMARVERGESLWHLGHRDEAVADWTAATDQNPNLALADYFLAGAADANGETDIAARREQEGDAAIPREPLFQYMIGLRLENVGMNPLAEKCFRSAISLDPSLRARRNLDLLKRF